MLIHKLYLMDFIIIFHNATSISTTPNAMVSFLIHALGFSFCYELHACKPKQYTSEFLATSDSFPSSSHDRSNKALTLLLLKRRNR
ncbi:hypothetical protein EYC80_002355 [Monilinia laxa]|uniref:Uncharacterized protein n=1 Tax=Monilinia laxa TaxID=61186 RepID=A0A5N6K3P5_MONLA|nr:hypothetical protein EYC80_002355 [Monilinia laxa]